MTLRSRPLRPGRPEGASAAATAAGRAVQGGFCVIPVLVVVLAVLAVLLYVLYLYAPSQEESSVSPQPPPAGASTAPLAMPATPAYPAPGAAAGPARGGVAEGAAPGGAALVEGLAALARGESEKAASMLREEYMRSPTDEVARSLAAALNAFGVRRFSEGDGTGARILLEEAAGLVGDPSGPEEATVFLNLAKVRLASGDADGAERALESVGDDPRAATVRKEALRQRARESYGGGDTDRAVELMERALELAPNDSSVAADLAALKREAEDTAGLSTTQTGRFRVRYEGGENAVAGHLISLLLEEAWRKVGRDLAFYPADQIEAHVYSKERFRDITRSPAWAGAIFDGKIKIPAGGLTEKTELLEKVIFHEYTHALVHRISGGRAPLWLNEGLAQYEEGGDPSRFDGQAADFASRGVSLRDLEGSFMGLSPASARAAYMVSLSATNYIIREYGHSGARRILESLARGGDVASAVRSALYIDYDELEQDWLASLGRRNR